MSTYSRQLADPKWQKRRLEILERDNFKCQKCGDDKIELQIHHKEYQRGKKVYEYADDILVTLCAHCHYEVEELKKEFYKHGLEFNYNEMGVMKFNFNDGSRSTIISFPGLLIFSKYREFEIIDHFTLSDAGAKNLCIFLQTYLEKNITPQ